MWMNSNQWNQTQFHNEPTFNTLRPRQNGRHFADDSFKFIFLNENAWILIKISLKFVPNGPIDNNPALVQIIAWRRPGDKPLSEPMMVELPTHICVTRPQWVKGFSYQVSIDPSNSLGALLISYSTQLTRSHGVFKRLRHRANKY